MEGYVFAAVLFAALMHASWNAIVKIGLDRVSTMLLLTIAQGVIALPLLPVAPRPDPAAWPWIAGSALLHTGYKLLLVRAYAHADLSQAYPLARGTAPVVVALLSVWVLGARFEPAALIGIAAISAGLLAMALGGPREGRMSGLAIGYALATAGFTVGYTMVDGVGARIAGTAAGFILWAFVLDAAVMVSLAAASRGRAAFTALRPGWRAGTVAGALSLGSYWIAVWAFTQAPIALVAALRETSILFATLISATVLRERVGPGRWAAVASIAGGVVLMRL
ncbi:EamA family transporter [Palleronia sediminis]|uniref:EamA family transporter n=1 Tax=Palleronia sediminis TaxID=2547833 RepID=A0A4R6AGH3_9RHOB|nr:EamA family transporter [Palleronia sediminis]TDL81548.1 EamA family transporter [Palleronia sediminis]